MECKKGMPYTVTKYNDRLTVGYRSLTVLGIGICARFFNLEGLPLVDLPLRIALSFLYKCSALLTLYGVIGIFLMEVRYRI